MSPPPLDVMVNRLQLRPRQTRAFVLGDALTCSLQTAAPFTHRCQVPTPRGASALVGCAQTSLGNPLASPVGSTRDDYSSPPSISTPSPQSA
jgi:hypothetical protein